MGNYLAIDISESEGSHVLGHLENGKLHLEEIHRFNITVCEKDGKTGWDFDAIFKEIKYGIKKCMEIGRLPIFVSLSAWESDFVLLDSENKVLIAAVSCQDTVDWLETIKSKFPDYPDQAESFMMVPDYLNFLLTGNKRCEYTNLYHSRLVCEDAKVWNEEQLSSTGFPRRIFPQLSQPGTVLGNLTREITEEFDYDCIIMQSASRTAAVSVTAKCRGGLAEKDSSEIPDAAVGNLLLLMIISHELADLNEARAALRYV